MDFSKWEEERKAQTAANVARIKELYAAGNYGTIELEYDGYGDSGQIESCFNDGPDTVPDELQDCLEQYVYNKYPGFEINDGASGTLTMHPDGRICIEHNERVMHYEQHNTEDRL